MTTQRLSRNIKWVFPLLALALIIAVAMMSTGRAQADIAPGGCNASHVQQSFAETSAPPITDGSVLEYIVQYSNPVAGAGTACNASGIDAFIELADGTTIQILNGATLNVGTVINCPGGAGCLASGDAFYGFTVVDSQETGPVTGACSAFTEDAVGNKINSWAHLSGDLHQDEPNLVLSECDSLSTTVKHLPVLSTEIHDAGHGNVTFGTVGLNDLVHDTALVATVGGIVPNPSSTLDFDLWFNQTCDGAPDTEYDGILLSAHGTPDDAVPVNGLSYRVTYNGDANYLPATDSVCEEVGVIDVTLTTVLHQNGENVISFGSTAADGDNIHDNASVTGNDGTAAGSIHFELFDNSACSGTPLATYDIVLGLVTPGIAETPDVMIGTNTTNSNISYTASYGGGAAAGGGTYPPISAGNANPPCEHLSDKPVGGVTNFFAEDSGSSLGLSLIAGGIAVVVAMATFGGWYTRRRWMGSN